MNKDSASYERSSLFRSIPIKETIDHIIHKMYLPIIKFNTVWNTQGIKSLFKIKDKVSHYSCIIFKGICSGGADYDILDILAFYFILT